MRAWQRYSQSPTTFGRYSETRGPSCAGTATVRQTARTAEAERARWRTAYAAERAGEHQAWLDATYAEARRRGACLACVIAPGWERARFVRHRRPDTCPERKSA